MTGAWVVRSGLLQSTIELVKHVQTKREIQAVLQDAGLKPRKRFGQHFLIDGNLMRRLVHAADLTAADVVLEVGPGTGGLTDLLVTVARHVICVEIDRDLFGLLQHRFEQISNIELICADALEGKHKLNPHIASSLATWAGNAPIKLVANLPYDVATPLLMNLLLDYPAVRTFCFTVQAEVAQRIIAPAGSKTYGPLGIVVQTVCMVEQIARLGPDVFWPRPQVDSMMLRLDRRETTSIPAQQLRDFAEFVHGVFEHRRKTLRSALSYVVSDDQRERICLIINAQERPEHISPADWVTAFHSIREATP